MLLNICCLILSSIVLYSSVMLYLYKLCLLLYIIFRFLVIVEMAKAGLILYVVLGMCLFAADCMWLINYSYIESISVDGLLCLLGISSFSIYSLKAGQFALLKLYLGYVFFDRRLVEITIWTGTWSNETNLPPSDM